MVRKNILLGAAFLALAFLVFPGPALAKSRLESKKKYAAKKYGKNTSKYKSYVKKYEKEYQKSADKRLAKKVKYYEKKYGKGSYLAKKGAEKYKKGLEKKYGISVKNKLGAPTKSDYQKYQTKKRQSRLDKEVRKIESRYGKGSYKAKVEAEKKKKYYEKKYKVKLKNPIGAPSSKDLEKEAKKWQAKLERDKAYYERKYGKGSSKAHRKVEEKLKYYEKQHGVDLKNPVAKGKNSEEKKREEYVKKSKSQMTAEYNKKLQDLADTLLEGGMSTKNAQAKVEDMKEYYEDKYDLALELPNMSYSGKNGPEITVKEDTTWKKSYIKDSIRRLGGIISDQRPVSTFIGNDYTIRAGFKAGVSIFDRKLLFKPPIGFPERNRPKKLAVVTKEVMQ